MSRRTEAKKARRKKRQAAREDRWLPDSVLEELRVGGVVNVAAELELFDERITERGWTFDDEFSEEGLASWFYAPSAAEVDEPHHETVTRICASDTDSTQVPDGSPPFPEGVSVFLVGECDIYTFTADELFDHLDEIEAYRYRDPPPRLGRA